MANNFHVFCSQMIAFAGSVSILLIGRGLIGIACAATSIIVPVSGESSFHNTSTHRGFDNLIDISIYCGVKKF